MERPESWFEDFGSAQLSGDSVTVDIDPVFAELVKTDDYHVSLTPAVPPSGTLYVSQKTPSCFAGAGSGGTSNIGFSHRVVAKRKDITGARLEYVDEPLHFEPQPPPNFAPAPGHAH
jgi:hypothetical protein